MPCGWDRGWDGWMASQTQWTWVWVNSGSWWRTGRSGVLRSLGLQSRTQISNWIELNWKLFSNKVVQTPSFTPGLKKYSRRPCLLLCKVSPGSNLDIMNTLSHPSFPLWFFASLPTHLFVGPGGTWWSWVEVCKIRVQILPHLLNFFMHQLLNPEKKKEN